MGRRLADSPVVREPVLRYPPGSGDNRTMDPRDRHFGPIASINQETDVVTVDFGDLVRKLVLSEQVILESIRLKELPLLVQKFGFDGIKELLTSGRLRIHCDALTVGQTGQTLALESRARKGLLPLGSYSFSVVRIADRKEYIHQNLQPINDSPTLKGKQAQKLRKVVAGSLVTPPESAGKQTMAQLERDLENNVPLLKTSVSIAVRNHFGREIHAKDFELRVERIDADDWHTETNLGERVGLDAETTHKAVELGLLGVGGFNQRLEYMESYAAMTGFKAGELPIMEEKLGFLARQLDPEAQQERFQRVIELVGLPDVDANAEVQDVDIGRLLEIVAGDEAQAFRRWLRGIDSLDNAAVEAEIHRIRDLVSRAVRSRPGKGVRFLTTTGIGIANPIAGVGAGALDSFLIDKLVPEPGPTAFLSQLYPSVFKDS
jgi:hypothetical protein